MDSIGNGIGMLISRQVVRASRGTCDGCIYKPNVESTTYAIKDILYIRAVWVRGEGGLPGAEIEWSSILQRVGGRCGGDGFTHAAIARRSDV